MSTRLTTERLAEIRAGQYTYRTVEQLDRDIRDLLAYTDDLRAELAEGKGTADCGEPTPLPAPGRARAAEVRFTVHGLVQLLEPTLRDLEPDHYGYTYRQLGGFLPDELNVELPRGTEHMEHAHFPGRVMPAEINVQVSTAVTRDGSRYMSIEWRRERRPAAQSSGHLRRTA
ncbi:hypothetical protein SLA_2387 [Streptomyces laurentii]|uniref:Uncharacterized protein n=1 Tax=Streptomyces laurentii TaxID=39478 RepID=A0A160NYG9_STRLU|nr:hypothetical protein SLA_2387 [Streptomyces laurentii]